MNSSSIPDQESPFDNTDNLSASEPAPEHSLAIPEQQRPVTPETPKRHLKLIENGVYIMKQPSQPSRLNSVTENMNHIDTTSSPGFPNVESPESPKHFLSPTDRGVYVIKPASEVSRASSKTEFTSPSVTTGESDRKQIYGVDENEERGNWTGRMDFLLSMLGYCVGLGNIWRFPYMCYRNGGGAFLLPFILMMTVVGVPLFYLETSLGQFSSCGPTTCWGFAPLFKGLGVSMLIVSALVSIYYNMIISWSMFYFFASFTGELPWGSCNNDWNTQDCNLKLPLVNCTKLAGVKYNNGTCFKDGKFKGLWNDTIFTNVTGRKRIYASEEYWNNHVLGLSSGIDDLGTPRWQLALTLLLAWLVCFLCLLKGIKTSGKVVYFTAVFPYVVLLILFFRGVTLDNASEGIYFYIVPKFQRLLDAKVWRDAALQMFYSLGPGWGGLMALSSYNRFHNNVFLDSIIVASGDALTSIFGGFVIFSYLGYMAGQMNVKVEDVVTSGAGLAFVVYPEAMNRLPLPTLWSLLFFFMLITLGVDSQFVMLESVLTGVVDYFPYLREKKSFVIMIICALFFLLGLPLTTSGGMYLLQLMDHYVASWSLLIIGLVEVIVISYVYGIKRFCKDMETMLGHRPSRFWLICWMAFSPAGITFILLFAWIDYSPAKYDEYTYPVWADVLGWLMSFCSVIWIPIVMLYKINKEDEGKNILERIKLLITPTREWGPALIKHRRLIDYVDGFVIDPFTERRNLSYVNYGFTNSSNSMLRNTSTSNSLAAVSRSYQSRSTMSEESFISYESTI